MADSEKADQRAERRARRERLKQESEKAAKRARRRQLKLTSNKASALTGLTPEQIADYKMAFKHFDKNDNGTICLSEFKDVLSSLKKKCTDKEAAQLFKKADLDGESDLDFNEFMYAMCTLLNGKDPSKIPVIQQMKRFEIIDTDGNGYISLAEFMTILGDYFPEESDVGDVTWWMMPEYDEDRDGKINIQEFLKWNVIYDL